MKKVIYKIIPFLVAIITIIIIGKVAWYYSDPIKFPPKPVCVPIKGWYADRRIGFDVFLGDITQDEAIALSGSRAIYKGENTLHCY
jgi:hypothetical protein